MSNTRRRFLALSGAVGIFAFFKNIPSAVSKVFSCMPTTANELGPFYKKNSPVRWLLVESTDPSQRLVVKGKVYASDCSLPLPQATVEVWQANEKGIYDNTSAYRLRGQVLTMEDGTYEFETVFPGSYDNRPSHIHYRISAVGYSTLVTQLYFQGDPLIARDPFASPPSAAARIVPLDKSVSKWKAQLDINLGLATGIENTNDSQGYLALASANPFENSVQIAFSNYASGILKLIVYDVQGRAIRNLFTNTQSTPDRQTVEWDGKSDEGNDMPNGLYTVILSLNEIQVGKLKIAKRQ